MLKMCPSTRAFFKLSAAFMKPSDWTYAPTSSIFQNSGKSSCFTLMACTDVKPHSVISAMVTSSSRLPSQNFVASVRRSCRSPRSNEAKYSSTCLLVHISTGRPPGPPSICSGSDPERSTSKGSTFATNVASVHASCRHPPASRACFWSKRMVYSILYDLPSHLFFAALSAPSFVTCEPGMYGAAAGFSATCDVLTIKPSMPRNFSSSLHFSCAGLSFTLAMTPVRSLTYFRSATTTSSAGCHFSLWYPFMPPKKQNGMQQGGTQTLPSSSSLSN
mmetsp:Transcript_34938/g.96544  ORF Transcript_34938/g.96544 Transcript_34938/m.96544 type:complete len:275 (-) Transcript_34938:1160-1984(-)